MKPIASRPFRLLPTPLKGRLTMTIINATRISDGKKVRITHEDRGDLVPAFDGDGNPFAAYTSYFEFPNGEEKPLFVQVDKQSIPKWEMVAEIRQQHDIRALASLGYTFSDKDIHFA